ncbi:MAG: ATP-binding protein [Cyanobacteria bacterium P01_A01_bin.83]
MNQPILCHFLVGLPASGKSTFARKLNQQIPNSVIVSTDEIRLRLFGDETVQKDWSKVEQTVIEHVKLALDYKQPVIYDATNVEFVWRRSFLDKIDDRNADWIAWWIRTPVETCKQWNKKRSRQVPEIVIDNYAEHLNETPPTVKEGFLAVRKTKVD